MDFDQAFWEKIVLLILTALLTGLGIPWLLKRIEQGKLLEQKKFEADLVRQGKILEAQSKLLDDLSELLWKWRYLAKKVVYYGAKEDVDQYQLARKLYDETVWDILNEFRAQISRSRRLISEQAYQRLNDLYRYVVHDIDLEISRIIGKEQPDVKFCQEMSERFSVEVSRKLDDALDDLASELNLKVKA